MPLIYLVRHAIAEERGDAWPDDTKRPLSAKGKARFREVVGGLLALDMRVDEILTSPLVRARQTADLLAAAFARGPKVTDLASLAAGAKPASVVADFERYSKPRDLALVGHEPGIGALAARLLGVRHALEFKKGAVCCIEVDALPPTRPGTLLWFATPRMLRQVGKAG